MNKLPLMEQFVTIQGEGFYSGRSAVFIRLGGCDVGCVWCDVKESWEASAHPMVSVEKIVDSVKAFKTNFVVITGGEPTMHDLSKLVDELKNNNIYVAIETAGTNPVYNGVDWICFSPKKFKKPNPQVYPVTDELKVVVFHKSDLRWAENHASKIINSSTHLYLQPEWSKSDEILPLVLDYIQENPKWKLSLQTHKYINIP
jgi:7-carboxy-7-deazaguanine synthase